MTPGSPATAAKHSVADAARRICSLQYDYPGCTSEQQWGIEATTKAEFKTNYDKGRWAQGPRVQNQFDALTDEHRDKLRRLYNNAVDAYVARQNAKGIVGKAAQPRYATLHDFLGAMECGGNFGMFSGLVEAACVVSQPINWLADNTTSLFLACDGWTVGGAFGGAAGVVKWGWTAVKVGSMSGAATGAAACTGTYLYKSLMPW